MSSVDSILSSAQAYAQSLSTAAQASVSQVIGLITPPGAGAGPSTQRPLPSLSFTATANQPFTFTPAVFDKPDEPPGLDPEFLDISEIEAGDAPTDDSKAPSIVDPTKPSALRQFSAPRPTIRTNFSLPSAPNYLRPARPELAEHDAPDKPELRVPDFVAAPPGVTELPPLDADIQGVIRANQQESFQTSVRAVEGNVDAFIAKFGPDVKDRMQAISDRLDTYLAGGTGLAPAVENAIYERARGKNSAEASRVRDTTLADMANRGFTLPGGAMLSLLQQARQAAADNNARAASEIVVQQAELEQKNLQFAMNTLVALRSTIINASIAYFQNLVALNGQSLEYAKAVLSSLIEAYNIGVKRFELLTEVFKSEIALYDTQAKAATLALELYRGELSALESAVNVDNSKVALYRSQVDAANLEIAAYKTQVEAVVSLAGLEKMKLDLASLEVQSFGLEVQAKEAEWRGFAAEMQGEEAKVRRYATEIEAFKSRVAAFQASIQAQAEVVKAQTETNQAKSMAAKSAVDVYMARIQAETQQTTAKMDGEKAKLAAHLETIKANLGLDELRLKHEIAKMDHTAADSKLRNDIKLAEIHQDTVHMQTVAQVSSIASTTLGGMAQAAMSGMNVLAAQTETI